VKKMLIAAALIPIALAENVKTSGQPLRAVTTGQATHRTTGDNLPPGIKKIYSNLGTKTAAYDSTNGWLILGPTSAFGISQWVGMPFTPSANSTASSVKVGVSYYGSGTNAVRIAIYNDNAGVPGTAMAGFVTKNLPPFGDPCCDGIRTVSIKHTSLTAGTQYWVVVMTNANESNTEGVWFDAAGDPSGNEAFSQNSGSSWFTQTSTLSAFGVFGTIP
jgi:hypothetical protein